MPTEHLELRIEAADLPAAALRVSRLRGREVISRLFELEILVICEDPAGFDAQGALGADAALVFTVNGVDVRKVCGMLAAVDDLLDPQAVHRTYRLRLVPRAHRLSLVETHTVFIDRSVPEILEEKLGLVDLAADVALRLVGTYPKREFTVQFGETDLAFASRLAEHLGVSFYFEHEEGRDVIVFTDHPAGFRPLEGAESIPFCGRGNENDVFSFEAQARLIPGLYVVRDYNYRTPLVDLTAQHELPGAYAGGVIEYGGHFKTPEEGAALARVRAEERKSQELAYAGKSDVVALSAGRRFTLTGHPHRDALELLLVEVEHSADLAVHHGAAGEDLRYHNTFRAIPAAVAYRPPRITPRPRLHGLYSGVIDPGEKAGQPYSPLDDQGRYLVRLFFDAGPGDRKASRPVRMAQPHAGVNYGMHLPLRPGVEVVVGFIGGDPDRPIIVGALYHPAQPSPVDERTSMVHRIRTERGIVIDLVDGSGS